jgi:RimJ/RimL family protein N-acetyltransferase
MPWAHEEPVSLETRTARLEKFAADFQEGRDTIYGIFDRAETMVLGGTGIHLRNGDHDREIGYWVRADQTGRGYITESTAALTTEAFAAWPIKQVSIFCNPLNVRSAAVPRRLGYSLEGIVPAREPAPDRAEDMIWRITREAWERR